MNASNGLLMSREEKRQHFDWRHEVNKQLPELAAKVFSFRGQTYDGCGFRYALEKKLGWLIHGINNYDEVVTVDAANLLEIIYEELKDEIAKIEADLLIAAWLALTK